MDAEGRVFGDAVIDPLPQWSQPQATATMPPTPPVPPGYPAMAMRQPDMDRTAWEEARADWLAECRQRFGGRGKVVGGVVGGLVGGIAGSAIAGRGNRTIGAVVGGVTGAVAGAALGGSADRRQASDYCASYLDRYMARYSHGYVSPGYGYPPARPVYGYAMQPMVVMMVPVMITTLAAPVAQPCQCTEVVEEEWVTVKRPAIRRYIQHRRVPDKRVRVYPDKRVRVY